MIVVNLFGAPGSGKSTGAAYIFAKLKMRGVNAELVTEFAKDKTWEGSEVPFKNQSYIFGEQSFRLSRCAESVDVVVTDSPLPLSIVYNKDERLSENFNQSVMDVFNSYENMNYFISRVNPYSHVGRRENETEANRLAEDLTNMLKQTCISYSCVDGCEDGYDAIVREVYAKYVLKVIDELKAAVSTKKQTDTKIDEIAKPLQEYLQEHFDSHTTIVVEPKFVRVVRNLCDDTDTSKTTTEGGT